MRDNEAKGRFEAGEGGETVFADYRRTGHQLFIDHVEAPPRLRGTGAAGALMEEIVAYAGARDLSIVPICGYAAHWLARRERGSDGA
jgi:predicted GNAT family acetyltransferase